MGVADYLRAYGLPSAQGIADAAVSHARRAAIIEGRGAPACWYGPVESTRVARELHARTRAALIKIPAGNCIQHGHL